MPKQTYQGPFREGNMIILKARGVTRVCIEMAVNAQMLDQIIPEPYALSLAQGVLRDFIVNRSITLSMIERWVQEITASARVRLEEEKAQMLSREIIFTNVQAAANDGRLQAVGLNRSAFVAHLIITNLHLGAWVSRGLITMAAIHAALDEAIAKVAAHQRQEGRQ